VICACARPLHRVLNASGDLRIGAQERLIRGDVLPTEAYASAISSKDHGATKAGARLVMSFHACWKADVRSLLKICKVTAY